MAIDNYTQAKLVDSFTVAADDIASDGTYTTPAIVLSGAFGYDGSSGGYVNSTTEQEDILVIRQFPFSSITDSNYNHTTSPINATEAWSIWSLPKSSSSGSESYTFNEAGNTITFKAESATDSSGDSVWTWTQTMSGRSVDIIVPPIKAGDKVYVFRKTRTDEKSIQFNPASKLTAASLNTAIDQAFRLGQENYALWHNFCKLNPAVGNPGGVCPLNAKGLIDEKYVDDTLFLTANNQDGTGTYWDAKGSGSYNKQIKNVLNPTADQDVTTKHWVENQTALNNYYQKYQVDLKDAAVQANVDLCYTKTETNNLLDDKCELGADGKIPNDRIPNIAISEFLGSVANEAARLALRGERGDWCIQEDTNKTYIITATGTDQGAEDGDWKLVATPTAPVASVNGQTGVVSLNAGHVGAYTTTQVDNNTYTRDQVDANTYNRTHIDNNHYTKTTADAATQTKVGSSITGTVEAWADGKFVTSTGFGNTEVAATGDGTVSRDLDDHFADWINVKDFGAIGDGVNDDTAAIQAALNHLTNGARGTVFFPYGRYKVTSTINVRENNHLDLNGSTIEFNVGAADTLFITASGSIDLTYTYTGTNTAFKKGDLNFSDSGLGADPDFMALGESGWSSKSLRIWTDDIRWYQDDDGDTDRYIGEWNKLAYVTDVGSLTSEAELANPLRYDYTNETSANVRLEFINTTQNIQIRNGILKDVSNISGVQNNNAVVINDYAEDVILDNVTIEGFTGYAVRVEASQNIKITNCTFKGIQDTFNNWDVVSYGVAVRNGCENVVVDNCSFDKVWRPFHGAMDSSQAAADSRGPSHAIRFTNNQSKFIKERSLFDSDSGNATYAGKTDYVGHNFWYCDDYKISDNTIVGGESFGIYGLGGNATITNNTIRHSGTEYPVGEDDQVSSAAVIQYYNATEQDEVSVNISGNFIDTTNSQRAIYVRSGALSGANLGSGISYGVIVSNNTIKNVFYSGGIAIEVQGNSSNKIGGLTCHGNIIARTHNGLRLSWINESIISSNRIICNADSTVVADPPTGNKRTGIYIEGLKDSIVNANSILMNRVITDSINRCITIEGGDNSAGISLHNNILEGCGSTSVDEGLYLNSDYEIWLSGNRFARLLTGINYNGNIDKTKVRTFGNLFSRNSTGESVGDHGDGKEMDTGWTPQIEWYYRASGIGGGSTVRKRPTNARFIVATVTVDTSDLNVNKAVLPSTYDINPLDIGLNLSETILHSSVTVGAASSIGDTQRENLSQIEGKITNIVAGEPATIPFQIVLGTNSGITIKDASPAMTLVLQITLLVADTVDTD